MDVAEVPMEIAAVEMAISEAAAEVARGIALAIAEDASTESHDEGRVAKTDVVP